MQVQGQVVIRVHEEVLKQSGGLGEVVLGSGMRESSTRVVVLDPTYDITSVRLVFGSLAAGCPLFPHYTAHVDALFHCVFLMEQYLMPESYIISAVECCCARMDEADLHTRVQVLVCVDRSVRANKACSQRLLPLTIACAKSLAGADELTLAGVLRDHAASLPVHATEAILGFVNVDKIIFEEEVLRKDTPVVWEAHSGGSRCSLRVALEPEKGVVLMGSSSTAMHATMTVTFEENCELNGNCKTGMARVTVYSVLSPKKMELIVPLGIKGMLPKGVKVRLVKRALDARSSLALACLCPEPENDITVQALFERYRERLLSGDALDAGGLWRDSLAWKAIQRWALLNRSVSLECYSNDDIIHFVQKLYNHTDFQYYPLQSSFFCALLNSALEQVELEQVDFEDDGGLPERVRITFNALNACAVTIEQWSSGDVKDLVCLLFPWRERWLRIPVLQDIARRLYEKLTENDRCNLIFHSY
jgi:hypothetical protein